MRAIRQLSILFLFLISSVIFYSCETSDPITSVNQDRIYQIYDARYNADSNYAYARATFRLENANGSYITLTGANANVKFNGSTMSEVSVFGITYYQFGQFSFPNPYAFVYTDANNATFSNSTGMNSMSIIFQNPPPDVMKSVGTTFDFVSSVSAGETVTLRIYNTANDSLVITKVNQTGGSSTVPVTVSDLSPLTTGIYSAQLTRQDQIGLSQQNSVGGVMNRAYVSVKTVFNLQP